MSSVIEEPEVAEQERQRESPVARRHDTAEARKDVAGDRGEAPVAEGESPLVQDARGAEAAKRPLYKRPLFLLVAGLVLVAASVFGVRYWLYASAHESTDDAFIDGHIIQMSPKVSGYVARVYVTDNQEVKEGDLLVEIDPRDFEARLSEAQAALAAGEARLKEAQTNIELTRATSRAGIQQASSSVQQASSGVEAARAETAAQRSRISETASGVAAAQANAAQALAQVAAAEAEAVRASADVERYRELYAKDEVSRQQLDQAVATARTATANLEAARKKAAAAEAQVAQARATQTTAEETARRARTQITTAQAQVGEALGRLSQANTAPQQVTVSQAQAQTQGATIEQLRAQVEQARLELSYTKIYAPESGRVTRKSVEEGSLVQPGQALMAIVPGDVWVTANFKETQLDRMRPGQAVEIKVDAYPEQTLRGHVDSIQAGTGAAFSLIPPENATGNYVKVVQRVPVKIVFDGPPDTKRLLAPGMSVTPEVRVK
jgi:membrane fusion protein (multidrug efflux system)